MGSEYDRKFEEMKKYIPFLESMIKRLESTSTLSSNPRQAQLDKIRSLRDLLLDKKKRMKMDNLLKCEQVLVNLYAKVEQKDTLPVVKSEKMDSGKDSSDLEAVRNKLKTVAKMQNATETLPEIARASEIEEICEPGSKEPALFQRRPNRSSLSPPKGSPTKPLETKVSPKLQSRRSQYTRVLVSPPRSSSSRWPSSEDISADKPLFSRRSPRRSPRRSSPTYHKKERKKPSKSKDGKSRKDLNITLKVPEESLHSLNTEDILSRIINCSDGDVDIDTLRELRSQILGELKQTGSNDDISELILKSYNKKSKSKKKNKPEVEEGEISDSESEIIENVYGSLVVMDKDKRPSQAKTAAEKSNQQRKIQICLVINSDKEGETTPVKCIDFSELSASENNKDVICIDSDASPSPNKNNKPEIKENLNQPSIDDTNIKCDLSEAKTTDEDDLIKPNTVPILESPKKKESHKIQVTPTKMMYSPSEILKSRSPSPVKSLDEKPKESVQNIANFYKQHPENTETVQSDTNSKPTIESQKSENASADLPVKEQDFNLKNNDDSTEIPLLNEPTLPPKAKKDVLSEIDILQALKNEILSETIPMTTAEVDTPALHQPKLSKVASSAEAGSSALQPKTMKDLPTSSSSNEMSKKRISIENYKKKSVTVPKSLFVKKRSNAEREAMKKQSLKLTEKECERFNFPVRLSLDDDTDDISDDDLLDEDKPLSLNDIYANLAPKSPDQCNFNDDIDCPVVIPVERIKSPAKIDVDLRTPNAPQPVPPPAGFTNPAPSLSTEIPKPPVFEPNKIIPEGNRKPLVDPRLRRDPASRDSPNPYGATNIEGTPRPTQFPNIPPLLGPIFTPSYAPSMTPIRTPNARSFEMTPSHQSFDIDEPQQKHVYAPSFSMSDNRDLPVGKDRSVWDLNNSSEDHRSGRDTRKPQWESSKGGSTQRDSQSLYNQRNDKYHIDRRDGYNRLDCPSTPIPSFGWSDGPGKPPFLEAPMTPSHPFGRSDCPPTPSHPFGRSDCPPTPNHPFGRSECPPTPSHPFGRSECPSTPSHPFGRPDYKDPRLNRRQSDYDPRMQHDDRDHGFHNEPSYNRSNSYQSQSRSYGRSNSPRNYDREQHYGRNDRYPNEHSSRYSKSNYSERPPRYESISRSDKNYYNESSDRGFNRERRDLSQNRPPPREDTSQLFTRNRDGKYERKYSDSNEGIGSRRQKERNNGQAMPGESIRAKDQSVNRTKPLSVNPQADTTFTIDTSVNSTFQNLIESGKGIQVFDYTFDARRQRAASVGRSLARESSVGRTVFLGTKTKESRSTETPCFQRRKNFQRASSVGRSLVTDKKDRSFQEIKAELKSFRSDSSKVVSVKAHIDTKNAKSESRSRNDDFEKYGRSSKHDAKQPYSPRKNYRDPRNNRNERGYSNSWDRRHSGISYSNDNIAKGTIMGSGFGVKNYKIPKIKRPDPEPPKTPVENVIKESENNKSSSPKQDTDKNVKTTEKKDTNKNSDDEMSLKIKTKSGKKNKVEKSNEKKDKDSLSDDGNINKNKVSKAKDSKVAIISDDDSEKRMTRSSKKSDSLKEGRIKKAKRIRKPLRIIDESDSDDDTDLKTLNEKTKLISKPSVINNSEVPKKQKPNEVSTKVARIEETVDSTKATSKKIEKPTQKSNTEKPTAEKEVKKTLEEDSLDSSFAIDDLEIFSDNIVSDPVIDNINDLIADLDSDIGTAKSTNDSFNSEMEKMIGAIDSQEENTLGDISDLIEKDLNESNEQLKQILTQSDDTLLNEVELVTGHKNTSTPVPTEVVIHKQDKNSSKISPLNIDSSKVSTVTEKNDGTEVNERKISEEKEATSGSATASNDETVSTTQMDQCNTIPEPVDIIENKAVHNTNTGAQSAPDSTIVQNDGPDKLQASLPDSTMEIHSEVSSDVTSTLNDAEKCSKETSEPSQSRKEISAIDSIGSILSILQDKSKIKELLSMLGEQSGETEKIKKKLEKLSEIVSDEEDDEVESREDKSKPTEKTLPDSQSNKGTEHIQSQEIDESIKASAGEEIGETDKVSNAKKNNEKELAKDVQSDKIEKAKCSQVSMDDNQVVNNNTEPPDGAKMSDDQTNDEQNYDQESNENQDEESNERIDKIVPKKNKVIKRGKKGKRGKVNLKRANKPKDKSIKVKSPVLKPKPKKNATNRELFSLQNDIKEMFMCNDVLKATGIRMCRLAKMVDKKGENDTPPKENEPVVLIEKFKATENVEEPPKKTRKKPGPKPKQKISNESTAKKDKSVVEEENIDEIKSSYKPGPKSKQKKESKDPYEFDTDSVADTNTTKESDVNSSDSESESLLSNDSFGSSEVLADIKKKPKKKRGSWQTGVIKPRHKKKKELDSSNAQEETKQPVKSITIPDLNCFTDKTYCFQRGVFTYDCRLCHYSGTEIVNHYKKQHAHTEVPLSRMDPDTAKKAIQQCEEINFQAISKIPSDKYTCRFCYKEFSKNRVALETFFWHVVSTHTGEYKHLCYECVNFTRCPFNLDIPPPPKEVKGQLIGYICGKCNFTQISLENLKTHVIVRHNDEQTEVYTINLGVVSQKAMKAMLRKSLTEEQKPRTLRSSRSNQSAVEGSELTDSDRLSEAGSVVPKVEEPDPHVDAALAEVKRRMKPGPLKSKITFEADDQEHSDGTVKVENEPESEYPTEPPHLDDTFNDTEPLNKTHDETLELDTTTHMEDTFPESAIDQSNGDRSLDRIDKAINKTVERDRATDVFEKPHFKMNFKESGAKEYVCCINGFDNHYKTTLLISLKKHVQTKHSETWDGYCYVCKVIVTLQGVQSSFKDCLAHFLDKHMDDFPVLEKVVENINEDSRSSLRSSIDGSTERTESPRIFVRPLSDLITKDVNVDPPHLCKDSEPPFPVIENVVSLGDKTVEVPQSSPVYPSSAEIPPQPSKPFKYEEVQAEVMSKKHRIVLDTMMPKELLVRVFKCAGRFCSFTSDSAEDSLVHASAHKQLGGEGSLDCAYCNFDAAGNAIDLVMHVFKEHGRCQYSCTMCFYRATADQLVGAHFTKAHATAGKATKVIRTTSVLASPAANLTNLLSRETAVPYYICNHGGGSCKFRTYTPGKFCEHLQQKHESEKEHPCNMCEVVMPTPAELVKHMKNHGVKLYQCTWCVHGANSESEMLSHAASLHPTKNPQAYLRIITNKEGSTEKRVLPLIYLNKLKETVEDVTPSKLKENPTREAERSIELEKLITHMALVETDTNVSDPVPETPITEVSNVIAEPSDLADEQTVQAIEKSLLSSPEKASQAVIDPISVKDEPEEAPLVNQKLENVVYCLDSDEEESRAVEDITPKPTVIDLSDEEPDKSEPSILKQLVSESVQKIDKPKFKKLPIEVLYKCPNCQQIFRNVGGFKRHTNTCCNTMATMACPHEPCPIVLSTITQLINHYNKDHNALNITKIYQCGECKSRWSTLNVTKKHLKDAHGIVKVVITSKLEEDGSCLFTIHKENKAFERPGPLKRKASVETPKKYGIEDIDKLPINPILDSLVYCNICEFSTKVRLNMVRHLQLHAERQPVPQTAPVNPVPHLETNEKHFDKMVNLASSSAAARADKLPAVPLDAIGRYPKYVPDRQRHTCGAKGCSYISVDEGMLRCHWETLHSAAVDYHCAHCPPHQHLDTSKLLTASRIIAHLKMHDANLYACSACAYYHYKKQIVEKHVNDTHRDKNAHVMIVREEGISNPVSQAPAAVGTMDLKAWQCGLCQFKSMLRRDLIEHCSKQHNTKMQYKCSYCPFRTSDVENITKHQANAHPTQAEDVFYYYYREGDVPIVPDGTPRWQIQRQKCGLQDSDLKIEVEQNVPAKPALVDLNLVKKEVVDQTVKNPEMTIDELCAMYGQFCDPNGISFKCPLCKTAMEFKREDMQSHLYEELNYRRWSCAICMYKAYHKAGLNEHIAAEHNRNYAEPTELPVNHNIEKWVSELLDHQFAIINKNKVPRIAVDKPIPGPSKAIEPPKPLISSDTELEQAFGSLGSPRDDSFCCPKCNITVKDEDEIRDHLESELTKIRWCCTKCTNKFPTFHEAQFHCKSHPGPLSRPTEAIRDPGLRTAWVSSVINTQKKSMKPTTQQLQNPETESENSLLVVRYEEAAPTEEQLREIARQEQPKEMARKRPVESDSEDEDSLVIYEPDSKKINDRNCPYCDFVSKSNLQYRLCMREHILRHYNLKILTCVYCSYNSTRKSMYKHLQNNHPDQPQIWKQTEIPDVLPSEYNLKRKSEKKLDKKDEKYKVCLHCEASVPEHSLVSHVHGNKPSEFGDRGDVVVKCCICLTLTKHLEAMHEHYKTVHPDISKPNYAYYQLQLDTREVQSCGICNRRFTFLRDLRIHHTAMHGSFNLSFTTVPYRPEDDDQETRKRKLEDASPVKHVAKKSTSKLPFSNIAKKSTTKLPNVDETDSDSEYSYYGTKPPSFNQYENVTTMMSMYNTIVEIDVKKLSGILKINPKVVVKDFRRPFTE